MMSCITTTHDVLPCRSKGKRGKIQVIFGPMFSGKSTELIRRMKRYQIANYSCLVAKYDKDDRYDQDGIATHDRQTLGAQISANELMPMFDHAQKFDVVGVDEGQFFPDIVEFCEKLADGGTVVVVAALDGTYLRQGFGNILNLVPLAESVVKLTAVCMTCYADASFTKRKGCEKEVEVIGGADKYLAVCRSCYTSLSPGKISPMKSSSLAHGTPEKLSVQAKRLFGTEINTNHMDCV